MPDLVPRSKGISHALLPSSEWRILLVVVYRGHVRRK